MKGQTPQERAKALKKALERLYDPYGGMDNVTDILTDLRHLCMVEDWDFFRCDRIARDHAAIERAEGTIEPAS